MKNISKLAVGAVAVGALAGCFQDGATEQQKSLADTFNNWDSYTVTKTHLYYNNSADQRTVVQEDVKQAASKASFQLCAEKEWSENSQGEAHFQSFVQEQAAEKTSESSLKTKKSVVVIVSDYSDAKLDSAGRGYWYSNACPK